MQCIQTQQTLIKPCAAHHSSAPHVVDECHMPAVLLLKHAAVTVTVARQQGEAAGSGSSWIGTGDKEENCDNEVKKLKHAVSIHFSVLKCSQNQCRPLVPAPSTLPGWQHMKRQGEIVTRCSKRMLQVYIHSQQLELNVGGISAFEGV